MPRLQRSHILGYCHPARWAGLLHFAPSALLDLHNQVI